MRIEVGVESTPPPSGPYGTEVSVVLRGLRILRTNIASLLAR